eukprot:3179784-Pyramimonas_sp.AAC.1
MHALATVVLPLSGWILSKLWKNRRWPHSAKRSGVFPLEELPVEILELIFAHLELREATRLACTSVGMRMAYETVRQGDFALPLGPTVNMDLSNHSHVLDIDAKVRSILMR